LAENLYCPQCRSLGDPQSEFCTACGTKLIPTMRIVIMPFVESEQIPESLGDYRQVVERDGELQPTQVIGCQLYMSSDLESARLIVTQKEAYFNQATNMLPKLVKRLLDPQGFYDIPDPQEVDQVTDKAANMPTELFVLIQNHYDPEYLFLPEINYFFFRYPRLHTLGSGVDSGFGFVQVSAFLLDNRENRIVSKGSGAGIGAFNAGDATLDENYTIAMESQMEIMLQASSRAIDDLLKKMKMTK
jgi:hypothetical protein